MLIYCLDFGVNLTLACLFYLSIPWQWQAPCLLIQFMSIFLWCGELNFSMWLGEIPSPEVLLRNWKTRMRRSYYVGRRWLTFQHYLWFTMECSPGGLYQSPGYHIKLKPIILSRGKPRRRQRIRRKRLRRFRRRRLAVPLVQRCRRRRSNQIPTLAGRSVPTRRSRRHRRWRRRNDKAKQRYWGKSPPIWDY